MKDMINSMHWRAAKELILTRVLGRLPLRCMLHRVMYSYGTFG